MKGTNRGRRIEKYGTDIGTVAGGGEFVPHSIGRLYTDIPKFDAATMSIYRALLEFQGRDGKYAFPSQEKLARQAGVSKPTLRSRLEVLEDCGLVETYEKFEYVEFADEGYKRKRDNNLYVVYYPEYNPFDEEDVAQFYEDFPEAIEKRDKYLANIEKRIEEKKVYDLEREDFAKREAKKLEEQRAKQEERRASVKQLTADGVQKPQVSEIPKEEQENGSEETKPNEYSEYDESTGTSDDGGSEGIEAVSPAIHDEPSASGTDSCTPIDDNISDDLYDIDGGVFETEGHLTNCIGGKRNEDSTEDYFERDSTTGKRGTGRSEEESGQTERDYASSRLSINRDSKPRRRPASIWDDVYGVR